MCRIAVVPAIARSDIPSDGRAVACFFHRSEIGSDPRIATFGRQLRCRCGVEPLALGYDTSGPIGIAHPYRDQHVAATACAVCLGLYGSSLDVGIAIPIDSEAAAGFLRRKAADG